jgi:hypothetical protein
MTVVVVDGRRHGRPNQGILMNQAKNLQWCVRVLMRVVALQRL